jgi:23S rRNA (adenine-N6)-dimethyltransferase
VVAPKRTHRDELRRRLGQNFLLPHSADQFVRDAGIAPGDLVVEIGAGAGSVTRALAKTGAEVIAVEMDPSWAARLRREALDSRSPSKQIPGSGQIRVVHGDFLSFRLPARPFKVVGSLPFSATTAILHRLLDDPTVSMLRADLVLQYEVARKRAAQPPTSLNSTAWAPWWDVRLGRRLPAEVFRPIPRVDAAVIVVTRRDPPLLPTSMARPFEAFVRSNWPFG